ncbi:MAG TPA: matrixin family metalloprotease [Egibacteraceae bacterium]|nr:matrixin family metalloprotease [Egibacteraceae bacterium]
MPPSRTSRLALAALAAVVLGSGLPAAEMVDASSGEGRRGVPAFCRTGVLAIETLPSRVPLDRCDLIGRTISAGPVTLVVPPRGEGRQVSATTVEGELSVQVRTTPEGIVEIDHTTIASASTTVTAAGAGAFPGTDLGTGLSWVRTASTAGAGAGESQDEVAEQACNVAAATDSTWYAFTPSSWGDMVVRLTDVQPTGANVSIQVLNANLDPHTAWCGARTTGPIPLGASKHYVRVATVGEPASFALRIHAPFPANDAFGRAARIAVPKAYEPQIIHTSAGLRGATFQPNEPRPRCGPAASGSVWYRITTPGSLRRIRISSTKPVQLFRGSTLSGLRAGVCLAKSPSPRLVVLPQKGPYYAQVRAHGADHSLRLRTENAEMYPFAEPPCDVTSHRLYANTAARGPLRWRLRAQGVPANLGFDASRRAIAQGVAVITNGRNDCGIKVSLKAKAKYLGRTSRAATLCTTGRTDGHNVVDFGPLPTGMLGLACSASQATPAGRWRAYESDVRFSTRTGWTVNPDAPSCRNRPRVDLVGVAAHEMGHVFGLDHPTAERARNQTMAPSMSACNGASRTLGRGDIRGLSKLY